MDVEYTSAVIERWLLPPEPPIAVECPGLIKSDESSVDSDSEADENDALSGTSTAISSTGSPLHLDEHETEYGSRNWWEQYSESTEEQTRVEEEAESPIPDHIPAEKEVFSEQEAVVASVPENVSSDLVHSKRQRKLNPKFADSITILPRRIRATLHIPDKVATEEAIQSESEMTSELEEKEMDEQITPDQEAEKTQESHESVPEEDQGESDAMSKPATEDVRSPIASPRSETETQKPVRNHGGKRKASPTIEPPIKSKRSLKINVSP